MGEEGRPQGVWKGGIRAKGEKGGWGREERPVPPIMAIGTGSGGALVEYSGEDRATRLRMWWGGCPFWIVCGGALR